MPRTPGPPAPLSAAIVLGSLWPLIAGAADSIEATVVDREGVGVPEVAVYAVSASQGPADSIGFASSEAPVARMDQRGQAFVPHVLIVETGTLIEFPNSDEVLHHVYSFSPAKRFELPLYAGTVHEPLVFDEPGLVTLGCNIHDAMLGYVLVVDTPHFALTDAAGNVRLDGLPAGEYEVRVWTPRQRPQNLPAPINVRLDSDEPSLQFQFDTKLYPPHEHSETSLQWSDY